MKKPIIFVALIALMTVILNGCTAVSFEDSTPMPCKEFICQADIETSLGEFICKIQRTEGKTEFECIEPEGLDGLKLVYSEKESSVEYNGKSSPLDITKATEGSFSFLIHESLNELFMYDGKLTKGLGEYLFENVNEHGSYTISVDGEGKIKSITLPEYDIKAKFTEYM